MKQLFFSILLLASICMSAAAQNMNDSVLLQLDQMIEHKPAIIRQKQAQIAHLSELFSVAAGQKKYDLCAQIYALYNGFNTDSAFLYSQRCIELSVALHNAVLEQQALMYKAQCLSVNGMYNAAKEILEPMKDELFPQNANQYYKTCNSMYVWQSAFTTIPSEQAEARSHIIELRHAILHTEPSLAWQAQERALVLAETDARIALDVLLPVFDTVPEGSDYIRYLANSLGSFYGRLDIRDSALYYYSISAISDLEHGIMEHGSLREVALILYQEGDVQRAYRYMNCCIEDAQFCKARLRTIEMANDMPLIMEAYQHTIQQEQDRQKRILHVTMVTALLLLLVALLACFILRKYVKMRNAAVLASEQLRLSNEQLNRTLLQLQEANLTLQEANRIRSAYVTQYMTECSEALAQMDTYHSQLLRVAMHSNYQKLLEAVKSTDFINENLRQFYLHFDETFLSLFPNFIRDFNTLLREDERFAEPDNKRLTTELRIFALIRLGITDSDDIARFLRHSTKTVYNYRAAVRNRAIGDRDKLEQQLTLIGM